MVLLVGPVSIKTTVNLANGISLTPFIIPTMAKAGLYRLVLKIKDTDFNHDWV